MAERQHSWDPARFLTYAEERGRPFVDLVARIDVDAPTSVVDLGCGPGNLTRLLAARWPRARVQGLDASQPMIDAARRDPGDAQHEGIDFSVADLREWSPDVPVDVLVCNATLQWVEGHLDLLPRLVGTLAPGGCLAFQVPGNFAEPSHELRRQLADQAPYAAFTRDLATPSSHDPKVYLRALSDLGCQVDVWETTYLHVLSATEDPDPVFTWVSGTGARPTLEALPPELRERFEGEFKTRLRAAYPEYAGLVVLPFRRILAVAQGAQVAR